MRIYENVGRTSENRLPPRSYYIPSGRSEYRLLNGQWRFKYFTRDVDIPARIVDWDRITVPSCWQTQGLRTRITAILIIPILWIHRSSRMIIPVAFMNGISI